MTTRTPPPLSGDSEGGLMTGNTGELTCSQLRNNMEEEEKGVGGEDRISRLPEALIHHILSLLPTKCAVSTTVLSKAWKDLWVTVPVLDFREWKSRNTQVTQSSIESFMDFMDRVLVLRNMSYIKRFSINCNGNFLDDQRIKGWISTAIKCGVEDLIVWRCVCHDLDIIPVDLYTCESLTLLEIEFCDGTLYLPQTISFPRLKILRLTEIDFSNEKQLFSGCPVLEELSLKHCTWKCLNLISSTLKVVTLVSCFSFCFDSITKIDAPNLLSIKIDIGIRNGLVVDSFPSLVDADIRNLYSEDRDIDLIPNFVKKLSNVKHLKLWGRIFERLELANVLSTSFPIFINLITLEVPFMKAEQVRTLFSFLQFSPNLESLVFGQVCCSDEVNEDALTLDVVPHCLLMHLKSIKFQEFKGRLEELDLVRLFLQNARVLQTVIIEISSKKLTAKDVENLNNNKIMEQSLKYKWASTDCVIKFLNEDQ